MRRAAVALAAVGALIASARLAGVRLAPLLDPHHHAAIRDFARGLIPPDASPAFLGVALAATLRTVAIALAGTALSLVIALPLAVLGTATLFRRGPLVEAERRTPSRVAVAAASAAARAVLGVLRAVPDLVWAMCFVAGFGLGPAPGVLALAVSYGGILGRVLADLFETVDPRPLEALRTTGASRTQIFVFGIWPQALPSAIAYMLYSFECCVRAAVVLGLVGAGGIGYEILLSMRMFEYGQVATLLVALLALVWLTDAASRALRRMLRANVPAGVLGHQRLGAGLPRLPRGAVLAGIAAAVIASAAAIGLFDRELLDAGALRAMADLARAMIPPALAPGYLRTLVEPVLETVATSVIATLIGVAIGGLLGVPAAAPYAEDDRARGVAHQVRRAVRRACRTALAVLRAVPDLLWVLMFLLAVGLGPFAGALALGVHTGGVLGKLYADALEEVSPLPLRGLRAAGATPLQILVWGAWPEARRMLVSYTLLRWEMNLRSSTVVGIAGGGGIGIALYNDLQLAAGSPQAFYPRVATLIGIVYLLVAATGWIGDAVLRRLESASLATRRAPAR
ncbi:MAG TPA: ABC transporter permease subunit [Kofleriaceae bacterium]|nr:ABC transporter permease subunit [Kofleriaceae bacterium]